VFFADARVQVMAMKSARAAGPVPMEEGRAVGGARWSQWVARFGIHRGSVFHVERERAAWLTCAEASRSPWSGRAHLGIAPSPRMRSPAGGGDVLRDDGLGSSSTWEASTQSRPSRGRSSLRARGAEGQRRNRSPHAGGWRTPAVEVERAVVGTVSVEARPTGSCCLLCLEHEHASAVGARGPAHGACSTWSR
jgi:hypothetical protein